MVSSDCCVVENDVKSLDGGNLWFVDSVLNRDSASYSPEFTCREQLQMTAK